jgi:CHAD domain-containing protein
MPTKNGTQTTAVKAAPPAAQRGVTLRREGRRAILKLLEAARKAARRLLADKDDEALHDLRVALRRLRVHLRPIETDEGAEAVKSLRRLGKRTNPARDAEVRAALAAELIRESDDPDAARWIARKMNARRDRTSRRAKKGLRARLKRIDKRVRRAVESEPPANQTRVDEECPPRIDSRIAKSLRRLSAMARWRDEPPTIERMHRTRLAVKRVRYALEPLDAAHPKRGLGARLETLGRLQTSLGEINDGFDLERSLRRMHVRAERRFRRLGVESPPERRERLQARLNLLDRAIERSRDRRDGHFSSLFDPPKEFCGAGERWLRRFADAIASDIDAD